MTQEYKTYQGHTFVLQKPLLHLQPGKLCRQSAEHAQNFSQKLSIILYNQRINYMNKISK